METFGLLPEPADGAAVWAIPAEHRPRFCLRSLPRFAILLILMTVTATLGTIGFSSDESAVAMFWPAAALQAVFSIWYGLYGALAGTLGPMLGNALVGGSAVQFAPANALQAALPGLIFRGLKLDPRLRSTRDWVFLIVAVCLACNALGAGVGVWEGAIRDLPGNRNQQYLQWFVGNAGPALVLVPLLLWSVSPTLVRQRGFFRSYWAPVDFPRLGPKHWLHLADVPMLNKLQLLAAVAGIIPLCILAVVVLVDSVYTAHDLARRSTLEMARQIRDENDRHELLIRKWAVELSTPPLSTEARAELLARQEREAPDTFHTLKIISRDAVKERFGDAWIAEYFTHDNVGFFVRARRWQRPVEIVAVAKITSPADAFLTAVCVFHPGTPLTEFTENSQRLMVLDRSGRELFRMLPKELNGWTPGKHVKGDTVDFFRRGGRPWYAASAGIERLGWRFVVVTDARAASSAVLTGVPQVLAWVVNMAIFAAIIASGLLARRIASRMLAIADHVADKGLRPGELKIPVTGVDELGYLAETLNRMSNDLAANITELQTTTAEKDRLTQEVELARALQQGVLPASAPEIDGYELTGFCGPALDVGGDFYDFFPVPADRVAIMVGDASGKGLKASMFMSETRGIARAGTLRGDLPDRALRDANRAMTPQAEPHAAFVTMFCGVLDPQTHCLHYSNAGHNRPLIVRDRSVIEIPGGSFPIGVLDSAFYDCYHLALEVGDIIVMYTDGVTEAASASGDMFGQSGLEAVLQQQVDASAAAVRESVLKAVRDFAVGTRQSDDITVVVLKRLR